MERYVKNTYCIQYWTSDDPGDTKVVGSFEEDGTPNSTLEYDQVYFYSNLQEAIPDARRLMDSGYGIKIRKCCPNKNGKFFLI
jgi:hypothetical protein